MMDAIDLANRFQSQGSSRSKVAALAFLVWETCITFDNEVQYIWMTPWTSLKMLYFFTRYYAIFVLALLNAKKLTCQQWVLVEGVSAVLLEVAVEIMLILRIRAMYIDNKLILRGVFVAFAAQIIIIVISLVLSIPKFMDSPDCLTGHTPKEMVAYTVASIVFEAILFILAVLKSPSAPTSSISSLRSLRMQAQNNRLITVLVRDSIWVFAAILAVMVINSLLFTVASVTLAPIGFPWVLAVCGSGGPRLMLNVREVHSRMSASFSSVGDISSAVLNLPMSSAASKELPSRPSSASTTSSKPVSLPPHPPAQAAAKPKATINTKASSNAISLKSFRSGLLSGTSGGSSIFGGGASRYSRLGNEDNDDTSGGEAIVSRYTPLYQEGGIRDTRDYSTPNTPASSSTSPLSTKSWMRKFTGSSENDSMYALHGHSPLREMASPVVAGARSGLRMVIGRGMGKDEESGMGWDAEDVHLLTPTTFNRDRDQDDHQEQNGVDDDRYKSLPPLPRPSSNASSTNSSRPDIGTRWI